MAPSGNDFGADVLGPTQQNKQQDPQIQHGSLKTFKLSNTDYHLKMVPSSLRKLCPESKDAILWSLGSHLSSNRMDWVPLPDVRLRIPVFKTARETTFIPDSRANKGPSENVPQPSSWSPVMFPRPGGNLDTLLSTSKPLLPIASSVGNI